MKRKTALSLALWLSLALIMVYPIPAIGTEAAAPPEVAVDNPAHEVEAADETGDGDPGAGETAEDTADPGTGDPEEETDTTDPDDTDEEADSGDTDTGETGPTDTSGPAEEADSGDTDDPDPPPTPDEGTDEADTGETDEDADGGPDTDEETDPTDTGGPDEETDGGGNTDPEEEPDPTDTGETDEDTEEEAAPADLTALPAPSEAYTLNIRWGDMQFFYSQTGPWNPATHSYDAGYWDDRCFQAGNNEISVENLSSNAFYVSFAAEEHAQSGADMRLTAENTDDGNPAVRMFLPGYYPNGDAPPRIKAFLRLFGTLSAHDLAAWGSREYASIGKIAITITHADTAPNGD